VILPSGIKKEPLYFRGFAGESEVKSSWLFVFPLYGETVGL
jgi:hypothetical protein